MRIPDELGLDEGLSLDDVQETNSDRNEEFHYEMWEAKIVELSKKDKQYKWELGELLVKGEEAITSFSGMPGAQGEPTFYAKVAKITGLAPNTLKDIASTYRRAASVRTDASWSHHRVVANAVQAALPRADADAQNKWMSKMLETAAHDNMSVAKLKEAVRSKPRPQGTSFRVLVPGDVFETLKDFADQEQSTVGKIAEKWLVDNSRSKDTQEARLIAKDQANERRHAKRVRGGRALARGYPPRKPFGE